MRERPGPFFFCSIGQMVQRTLRVAAAPHHQGEADQASERHERALGMVGHPQPLLAAHTLLSQWSQAYLSLGWRTGISSGHLLAPSFSSVGFLPPVSSSRQDRLAILEKKIDRAGLSRSGGVWTAIVVKGAKPVPMPPGLSPERVGREMPIPSCSRMNTCAMAAQN